MSFRETVKNIAISSAPLFKAIYIDFEYLVCSEAFTGKGYYILTAKEDNYEHLIGVNTPALSAHDFFTKCIDGMLVEDDFNFIKTKEERKSINGRVVFIKKPINVKNSVKQKIRALPLYLSMMGKDLVAQESRRIL